MNQLPLATRVRIAAALADGVGMRGTERLTGVTRKTIGLFLLTLGDGCDVIRNRLMRDLTADVIELDEVWAYVGVKQGHKGEYHPEEFGDAYTFVAFDATSRAVITHLTDKRTGAATFQFAEDLRARVLGKPQITSDGWVSYVAAIENAFGTRVHYAKNLKTYAADESGGASRDDVRYSRGRCIASQKIPVIGSPDEDKITTAHIERNNLTTRLWCRRLTRLTMGFSRRLVFLRAALTLHFAIYNFTRVHSALRVTPAMQLGVTDHVWSMEELVDAAIRAVEEKPTTVVTIAAPPTVAIEAGARVRAAKRSAARKIVRESAAPRVSEPTVATSATVKVTVRRPASIAAPEVPAMLNAPSVISDAPRSNAAVPAAAIVETSAAQLELPLGPAPIVPRALCEPADAANDFRWMW